MKEEDLIYLAKMEEIAQKILLTKANWSWKMSTFKKESEKKSKSMSKTEEAYMEASDPQKWYGSDASWAKTTKERAFKSLQSDQSFQAQA